MKNLNFDIFCNVIDNFGDAGVCLRFAREISLRGYEVNLYCNKLETLNTILNTDDCKNSKLKILNWTDDGYKKVSLVVVQAFSCRVSDHILKKLQDKKPLIINLEYLSAEDFVESFHGLLSPINNLNCYFFFPGFTKNTGGLLIENSFLQKLHNKNKKADDQGNIRYVNIFSYQNKNVKAILDLLTTSRKQNIVRVFNGLALDNINKILELKLKAGESFNYKNVKIEALNMTSQDKFDDLLIKSDFNLVRGEDSIVRAMLCGNPFLWQIYVQEEKAHIIKLNSFLDKMKSSVSDKNTLEILRKLMLLYNDEKTDLDLTYFDFDAFESKLKSICSEWSAHLIENGSLTDNFLDFCKEKLDIN